VPKWGNNDPQADALAKRIVETLREAQRHPERYASLQIRVTGFRVYFNSLSKHEQDQFIVRNAHTMS
jgi:pyruvate-formate lyase